MDIATLTSSRGRRAPTVGGGPAVVEYEPQPLRSLEEIRADIIALEAETEGVLQEIVGTLQA